MLTLLEFIFILLIILFLFWQFKMLKKYALKYDKFKINLKEEYLSVNGYEVNFKDIDYITVRELEQPSTTERMFSKSAYYVYMSEVIFHLKQGPDLHCTFNYKGTLYKTLKKLEPYVKIDENIEYYKPHINWGYILLIIAIVIAVFRIAKR